MNDIKSYLERSPAPPLASQGLELGAKLGVAYHLVQENTSILAPTDSHSRGSLARKALDLEAFS